MITKNNSMRGCICSFIFVFVLLTALSSSIQAQNPIVRDQFSADPSVRFFNGKFYVFPSHDIQAPANQPQLRKDWFCMADYHVFSSDNLTDWKDHGVIVSQEKVAWVDSSTYSMWAPDCIERNGKYYFYFPANTRTTNAAGRKSFGIGVAVADKPEGPYVPQKEPIAGVHGIDPNVFIDKDGQAYLYWSMQQIFVARLKDNMLELDSEPVALANLPTKGLKEGPYVIERKEKYYLTFPHVENKIERLEYAVGDSPMGPFHMAGVIMDESPMNCWTNHQSLIEANGQWYLFYHQNAYSPEFDKNRAICIDSLFFNADGSIQKVIPTHRGVGLSDAGSAIQIDRYSSKSESTSIGFLNPANPFDGWKTTFPAKGDWIRYNSVQFDSRKFKSIQVQAKSQSGGTLQVRQENEKGKVIAEIKIPESAGWKTLSAPLPKPVKGIIHLVVMNAGDQPVEVDWIRFAN